MAETSFLGGLGPSGASAIGSGLFKMVGGLIGGGKRRREQRRAKKEYGKYKNQYMNLENTNLYLGQENVFEDLTVNQQQAEFETEQQQQGLANIMARQQEAAGGSGIASLAQALANQQTKNIALSAVSIGQEEQKNQLLRQQAAGEIQQQEIYGEEQVRSFSRERTETLLGMSGERYAAANKARQDATASVLGGLGDIAGGALSAFSGGLV